MGLRPLREGVGPGTCSVALREGPLGLHCPRGHSQWLPLVFKSWWKVIQRPQIVFTRRCLYSLASLPPPSLGTRLGTALTAGVKFQPGTCAPESPWPCRVGIEGKGELGFVLVPSGTSSVVSWQHCRAGAAQSPLPPAPALPPALYPRRSVSRDGLVGALTSSPGGGSTRRKGWVRRGGEVVALIPLPSHPHPGAPCRACPPGSPPHPLGLKTAVLPSGSPPPEVPSAQSHTFSYTACRVPRPSAEARIP